MRNKVEHRDMNASIAADDLRFYAAKNWPLKNHKYRKSELQKLLGVTARRIASLYEGSEAARVRPEEAARIKQLRAEAEAQIEIEEANRNDFAALQARIAALEAALFAKDQEFHQPQVDAYREALDGRRGNHVARRFEGADASEFD